MRVLFTTQPAFGHAAPLLPLAQTLHRLGHEVRLASSPSFAADVDGSGIDYEPAGIDWLEARPELTFPDVMDHRGLAGKHFMLGEVFCRRTAEPFATDLLTRAEQWRPDVVVREPWEFGGAVLAAVLGVPCVVHGIGTLPNTLEVLDVGADQLTEVGHRFGLEGIAWARGAGYIDPCPASLAADDDPHVWFDTVWPVQPVPHQFHSMASPTTDDANHERDRPRVYVGMGTVMNRKPGLWRSLVEGLADVDADFVLSTGPGNDPAQFGPYRQNMGVHEVVDLARLLPTCDAVICHAGWSTTMAALWHGLSLVLVPLGSDGPTTIQRVTAIGAATTVAPDDIREHVAEALTTATQAPTRAVAKRLGDEMRSMPSLNQVAESIITLAK